ncbi:MAG: amidohydrolase family protein [Planctomycetales bacterium]|nr:amidohydrolase family protein [Planctomycetales bacterium]
MPNAYRRFSLLLVGLCLVSATSALAIEPVDDADQPIPIVDCHVHLYSLDRPEGITWIAKDNKTLFRSFLPEDHQPIAKANGVQGVVVVQAGQSLPDNQWNLDVTAHNKRLYRGVVGNLSQVIGTDGFKPLFDKLCEDPRYVGYRLSGRYQTTLTDAFFRDLKLTAARGKTVDVLAGDYSLADVATIAERVPDLRIIIDHFGNLRLDGRPLDPAWVKQFQAVAQRPNVTCKVSALYGRVAEQPAPRDIDFYRPVLDLALESFGEDRLIFGSDWPVTRTSGDYASVVALTKAYFDGKGRGLSEKLFYKNALRFYALGELNKTD